MITIYEGLPGAGKSVTTAKHAISLIYRNLKWYKRSGIKRKIYSNIRFNDQIVKQILEYYPETRDMIPSDFVSYWVDPEELVTLRDVDVIWDEVATHLDATQWANVPLELKRWLQQHRKFGIEIIGNTQVFPQIDISMRRLTAEVITLYKAAGSRDPSPTTPPVTHVWGLILGYGVDPQTYDENNKKVITLFPTVTWISKTYTDFFDTRQEIKMGIYPPLRHIERHCIDPECSFHRVTHA